MRVKSRVHLDILPSNDRASMTRLLALLVRNTNDRDTIPPDSWCANGAMAKTGRENIAASLALYSARRAAKPVASSTGSRTRRKMVLFQVEKRWRQ